MNFIECLVDLKYLKIHIYGTNLVKKYNMDNL